MRLHQQHLYLSLSGARAVFDPFGNDIQVSWTQRDGMIPHFDIQLANQDEEQVISVGMAVPREFPLNADYHDIVVVVPGYDARRPMIREAIKFMREVYWF